MPQHADPASKLGETVRKLRPFVPTKDFEASKRFYADLGFQIRPLDKNLAEVALGDHSFLLQNYFVEQWASNFMMHVLVSDVDAWWRHIDSLDLPARYGVPSPKLPKLEEWGLRTAYVIDPAGVLWHIAERPTAKWRTRLKPRAAPFRR